MNILIKPENNLHKLSLSSFAWLGLTQVNDSSNCKYKRSKQWIRLSVFFVFFPTTTQSTVSSWPHSVRYHRYIIPPVLSLLDTIHSYTFLQVGIWDFSQTLRSKYWASFNIWSLNYFVLNAAENNIVYTHPCIYNTPTCLLSRFWSLQMYTKLSTKSTSIIIVQWSIFFKSDWPRGDMMLE